MSVIVVFLRPLGLRLGYAMVKAIQANKQMNQPCKDKLDLCLSDRVSAASLVALLGYILYFVSALEARQIIIARQAGSTENQNASPTPSELFAAGTLIILITNIIFLQVSYTKLIERQREIRCGSVQGSIVPNNYITAGFAISVLGSIVQTIGTQMRATEPGSKITII